MFFKRLFHRTVLVTGTSSSLSSLLLLLMTETSKIFVFFFTENPGLTRTFTKNRWYYCKKKPHKFRMCTGFKWTTSARSSVVDLRGVKLFSFSRLHKPHTPVASAPNPLCTDADRNGVRKKVPFVDGNITGDESVYRAGQTSGLNERQLFRRTGGARTRRFEVRARI